MYPSLFSIGPVTLHTYGLFVALGFLAAVKVSKKLGQTQGISPETVTDLYLCILISAIVGARLLYVLIDFDSYKNNLLEIFVVWNGGLVFFGGFCAAVVAAVIMIRIRKLHLWKVADIIAPGVALGHVFGRMGCFFAGCCHGKPCDLFFAVTFNHPETLAPRGIPLHPTQLYSVVSNLIIFGLLLLLHKKKKFDGMVFLIYLIVYALFRSAIEFFRDDFRGYFIFDFLSMSQGIGLVTASIAFVFLIRLLRKSHGTH